LRRRTAHPRSPLRLCSPRRESFPQTRRRHELGSLFVRCPYCGDSKNNRYKAHFSINTIRFVYHCFRCGVSGKLSNAQMLSLIHELPNMEFISKNIESHSRLLADIIEELHVGAGSSRQSRLSRWHHGEQGNDAFLSRSITGQVVGVHIRPQNKNRIRSYGMLAFGYGEEELISSPGYPLRIVEGAYDVLHPKDVCVFGTINYGKLKALVGHYIKLCPDGDIWQRPELFKEFHRTIKSLYLNYSGKGAWITGIEYIKDGRDPDEVSPKDREYIPIKDYLQRLESSI